MRIYEDDVFGVPYFKVGRQRFWGLDRLEDFLVALDNGPRPASASDPVKPGEQWPEQSPQYPPVDDGTSPGPIDGIPHELIDLVASMDRDTAGGCG